MEAVPAELLEDRLLLSIHSVLNTNDSGAGSLRQAILDANAATEAAQIVFEIPDTDPGFVDVDSAILGGDADADVFRIQPLTALPAINNVNDHAVTVDGTTQETLSGNTNSFGPEIELDGSIPQSANGLQIQSDNVEIRGLVINRFSTIGVLVQSDDVVISGNFVGTDATGTIDSGNGWNGIEVRDAADNVTIGGTNPNDRNVISGNAVNGIGVGGSVTNVQIAGNLIGTDATGASAIRNERAGIAISSGDGVTIGGPTPAHRNILSGNGEQGIFATGSAVQNLTITSNYIGLNADGDAAVPNGGNGDSQGIRLERGASNIVVGAPGAGNVVSGNLSNGIGDGRVENITIQSNIVGLDATGTFAIPNEGTGIRFFDATNLLIGGLAPGERNIVSGNRDSSNNGDGISVRGTDLRVIGNFIGTDITGTVDLGNVANGINVDVVDDLEIVQNVVSGNGRAGIFVEGDARGDAVIRENLVGSTSTGDGLLPNDRPGIWLLGTSEIDVVDNVSVGSVGSSGLIVDRSRDITIQGNMLGVLADGTTPAANDGFGLYVLGSYDLDIDDNTISGNRSTGVRVQDSLFEPIIVQWPVADGGNDHWYWLTPDRRTWESHEALAVDFGTHLVTVNSSEENAFVVSALLSQARNGAAWHGFNDAETEGSFVWSSGESVTYTNWSVNEPNGLTGENHAHFLSSGSWNDTSRLVQIQGIIEFETEPDPAALIAAYGNVQFTGNRIGVGADGTTAVPNAYGFDISNSANVIIGGPNVSDTNTIAHNTRDGVHIRNDANVTVTGNSIHSNGQEGIDLAPSGVNSNDALDADSGPNQLQNSPVLNDVVFTGTFATISGTLHSTPDSQFEIEVFGNSAATANESEGETFVSRVSVVTDNLGNATFSIVPPSLFASNQFLTATATDSAGNTSEFSSAVLVEALLTLSIDAAAIDEDGSATATVTRNTNSDVALDVMVLIDDGTELSAPLLVTIPAGSATATFEVSGVQDLRIDGTQTVSVSVAANGVAGANVAIDVVDNETGKVSVSGVRDAHESNLVDGLLTVNLDTLAEVDVDVSYTVTGSATNGVDFVSLSGTATILAGLQTADIDVRILDDGFAELIEDVEVTLTSTSLSDNVFVDSTSATDSIRVFSDDLRVIEVTPSTLTVSEDGSTATFDVTLGAQPSGNVVVSVVSGNVDEATVSASTLTFTAANWNTPQTVTITGVDDAVADGTQELDIVLSIDVGASNAEYQFASDVSIDVLNVDNEAPATVVRLEDVTFFNNDAVLEDGLSVEQNGQRSIVKRVQVVLEGETTITAASVSDGTFSVTNLDTGLNVGLVFESSTAANGRTVVVLSFAAGASVDATGSLIDGNYQFNTNGGPQGFDADGSGTNGGTQQINFHRLFGDTDGDRDVDNADFGNLYRAFYGDLAYQNAFDRDDDNSLFDEIGAFFSNYGRFLSP